jgi:hypothetical protein
MKCRDGTVLRNISLIRRNGTALRSIVGPDSDMQQHFGLYFTTVPSEFTQVTQLHSRKANISADARIKWFKNAQELSQVQ